MAEHTCAGMGIDHVHCQACLEEWLRQNQARVDTQQEGRLPTQEPEEWDAEGGL